MKSENNIFLFFAASSDLAQTVIKELNEKVRDSVFVCTYRSEKASLEKIEMKSQNKLEIFYLDMSDENQINLFLDKILLQYGCPTDVINFAASKFKYNKLKELSYDEMQLDIKIQTYPIILLLNKVRKFISKNDFKLSVIFVLSIVLKGVPPKYLSQYVMTKYGVLGMMHSLTADYTGKNIRFNAVSPDMMNTKFLSDIDERMLEMSGSKSYLSTEVVSGKICEIMERTDYNGRNIFIGDDNGEN
jgi:3-oxoacyl-[acyl-carrier protein] reductase